MFYIYSHLLCKRRNGLIDNCSTPNVGLHYVALRFNNTIASDSSQSVTDRLLYEANQVIGLLDYQSLDPSFPFSAQDPAGEAHDAPPDPLIGWGGCKPPPETPHPSALTAP